MSAPDWRPQARACLQRGYLIVPIRQGEKRPAIGAWQSARLGADDIKLFARHGVGVLCGQGAHPVAALDIDSTDADLVERFATWCRAELGVSVERVGAAPKLLIAYRASAPGWGKAASAWYEAPGAPPDAPRHRLEVLGKGQQFVAYHVHPDTRRPYSWVDLAGGLEETDASELPVVTPEGIALALSTWAQFAAEAGLRPAGGSEGKAQGRTASQDDDDPLMSFEPPVGLDYDRARSLMAHIDNADYETWLRVGTALHHEFDGADEALDLWDEWSRSASNYADRDDLEKRWQSFGRGGQRPITARWLLKAGRTAEREAAHQEKRNALEGLRGEIEACTDSIVLVGAIASTAGESAGDDLAIRAELAGLIRARFRTLTGTPLPVADVRAAMQAGQQRASVEALAVPLPNGQRRPESTEFGLADRMLAQYGAGLRYVPELAQWLQWTGVHWRAAQGAAIEHIMKETVRGLLAEALAIEGDDERRAFIDFYRLAQRAFVVANAIKLASSDPRVVTPVAELDRHWYLIAVGNGTVDLRTGHLRKSKPDDLITMQTPVCFDPDAECPVFDQTILDAMDDDAELAAFVLRVFGYALRGRPSEQCIAILFGSGANGKSTIMDAVREAFGAYAASAAAETFMTDGAKASSGGPREDVLRLKGKRLVHVAEPDEGAELREGFVKSLTGGDRIPARGVYGKTTIEVAPTWVPVLPTNHRPIIKGDDHAIWRRILLVPFTRNFDLDVMVEKDPHRAEKLRGELPGILRRIVEASVEYGETGLGRPTAVAASTKEYRENMDLLADWLAACCEVEPSGRELTAALWSSWESFARERGELRYLTSARALGRRLASRFGAYMDGRGRRGFRGVRLKAVSDL